MAFVDEITPEQKSLMPSYREKWHEIAFLTNRIDQQKSISAIQDVYELLKLPTPEIQLFDSLYAATKIAKPLYKRPYFTETGLVHANELIGKIHEKLYINNINAIGHWDEFINSQLRPGATSEIDRQLSESFKNYLLEDKSKSFSSSYNYYWFVPLHWYAREGGFFDFHFSVVSHTLFEPYDESAWKVFQKLVKSCGWIIPFENICLVCDRPTQFLFDSENLLHAEGEAAVKFIDGNGLYSYHGVTLPMEYGENHPHQWQPKWLLDETDTELKKILVRAITSKAENYKTRYFKEALEMAASVGRLNIVQQILAIQKFDGHSLSNALAHGVWSRDIKILEVLVQAGAYLNLRTEWGTPLIAAARTGDVRIVRYLVEAGADPNMWIDYDGYMSPLSEASYEGHQEVCDYLLPLITDPEEIEYAERELPKAVIRKQRRENQSLQKFFDAVSESDATTVRELVAQGLDINSLNENGITAVHCAVNGGNVRMIKLLAELGVDLNRLDEDGRTPLMRAIGIYAFQARALRTLIRAGADFNYRDQEGYTALDYAVLDSSIPRVFEKILLSAGAQHGCWKGTEIHLAASSGNVRLINILVSSGIDVNLFSETDGLTPLMKAVIHSRAWAMRTLIRAGANVNSRTENGETALYFAEHTGKKHPVIKKILLKVGATY
ncbi:ankyrin repeat domain-containing protein [Nostoc spongiaeforme FACHB-130]|uniref:Ankyrin repeat domain-containing protein n=1 Tax=Nostoc spongiaeforme FACHB-130 TaxID=1357510 RepID=A0ABR8FZB1_9NOSO|nr:ankyrin repeat domain-containing protein [Nostoc spongiaeforme]MBD2595798.1 ankyrin repeat domain-containing protein [Nostoc spongiaeforme FACHB-130]